MLLIFLLTAISVHLCFFSLFVKMLKIQYSLGLLFPEAEENFFHL